MGIKMRFLVQTPLMVTGGTGSAPDGREKPDEGFRERIIDAATAYYATEGFSGANLDKIGHAAGVSTADLIAQFGDEAELRSACDEHVLQALVGWAREKATLTGMSEVMRSYTANPSDYQTQVSYLGRVVAENTPAAARFTDVLVDESESIIRAGILNGTMRPSDDPRALAVLLATTVLGMVAMTPHIERILGVPAAQQQMMIRLAVPALELYTYGLYTDDSYLALVRQAIATAETPRSTQSGDSPSSPD